MTQRTQIKIEGYSPDEILAMSDRDVSALVFTGQPIIFKAGTAEILGEFSLKPETLVVELAQINGAANINDGKNCIKCGLAYDQDWPCFALFRAYDGIQVRKPDIPA